MGTDELQKQLMDLNLRIHIGVMKEVGAIMDMEANPLTHWKVFVFSIYIVFF